MNILFGTTNTCNSRWINVYLHCTLETQKARESHEHARGRVAPTLRVAWMGFTYTRANGQEAHQCLSVCAEVAQSRCVHRYSQVSPRHQQARSVGEDWSRQLEVVGILSVKTNQGTGVKFAASPMPTRSHIRISERLRLWQVFATRNRILLLFVFILAYKQKKHKVKG